MDTSENTRKVLSELIEFTGNKIKNHDELALLIEISLIKDNISLFNDITFNAKYLNGLGKILHTGLTNIKVNKSSPELNDALQHDSINKVRNEYKIHLEKFINQLNEFIKPLQGIDEKEFRKKFLSSTQLSMVNLTNLIYDLSWLKKFSNRSK